MTGRWLLAAVGLAVAVVACGIAERRVEERAEGVAGRGGGGASGLATGGSGFGGVGMPGGGAVGFAASPGQAGGFPGAGGTAAGGKAAMCTPAPFAQPSCGEAGVGGALETSGGEAGWCANDAANERDSQLLMVDDFEDGDGNSLPVLEGRGLWYVVNDGTGTQYPDTCVAPVAIDDRGDVSAFAMHTVGYDFASVPGAYSMLGMSLRKGAPACDQPVDASAYTGVEFWARGSGVLRFYIPTLATNPVDNHGTCTSQCYDAHGFQIMLGPGWGQYRVPFAQLFQEGWGAPAPFLASELLALHWSAKRAAGDPTAAACFDFWIDDVAFYRD